MPQSTDSVVHWVDDGFDAMIMNYGSACSTNQTASRLCVWQRYFSEYSCHGHLAAFARLLYALRVLRVHGLPQQSLNDVFRATIQAKILYASPAWSSFGTAADIVRLNSFLRRCRKLGYSDGGMTFEDMCTVSDKQLFSRLINHTNHVLLLHRLLPPPTTASQHYNLRPRRHTLQLPEHHTRLLDS